MDPSSVMGHATECWATLWKTGNEMQEPVGLPFDELPGMPPLQGELLRQIATHIHVGRAGGLDAWGPWESRRLPKEAYRDFAQVFTMVETEGVWPR